MIETKYPTAVVVANWFALITLVPLFIALPLLAQTAASASAFQTGVTAREKVWAGNLRKEAEQGSAKAEYLLGKAYLDGRVFRQNLGEAAKWTHAAADQGWAEAEVNLAAMYHEGRGVPRDDSQSLYWNHKAAEQGDVKAEYNLGFMYALGLGGKPNLTEAIHWYERAAEQGHQISAYNLGVAYSQGIGVSRDEVKGYMWQYVCANQFQYMPSQKALETLTARLSRAQISEGRRRADEWRRRHSNVRPVTF